MRYYNLLIRHMDDLIPLVEAESMSHEFNAGKMVVSLWNGDNRIAVYDDVVFVTVEEKPAAGA